MKEPKWRTRFRKLAYRKTHLLPQYPCPIREYRFFYTPEEIEQKELSQKPGFDPGEDYFYGFRSVIMYFQLSTQFRVEVYKILSILEFLDELTHFDVGAYDRFGLLFLNDENYKLIPFERMLHTIQGVKDVITYYYYYKKYDQKYEQYSGRFTELFSDKVEWEITLKPPILEDLCLVFHKYGENIDMDEDVQEHYEKIKQSWIWLGLEGSEIKSIRDYKNKWEF